MAARTKNLSKMREIAQAFYLQSSHVVYDTIEEIVARVTGHRGGGPKYGATPIGNRKGFRHGLLLGNWRLSTHEDAAFNPKSYIVNREIVYSRLMSFAGHRDYMLGKKLYLSNSTPYAEEIDEASGNKRYQAKNGILPEASRMLLEGRSMSGYRQRLKALGFTLKINIGGLGSGGPSVFYPHKEPHDDMAWKRMHDMYQEHRTHPFHEQTTAPEDIQKRAIARERRNARTRYNKALEQKREELGINTPRKTKKGRGKGNK